MAITRPTLDIISLPDAAAHAEALARVTRAFAFRYDVFPMSVRGDELTVAVGDPDETGLLDRIRSATRLRVRAVALPREQIRERLQTAYGPDPAAVERRPAEGPAVRAVDAMFARAIAEHASDIHVEPHASAGRIRLRIDGILRQADVVHEEQHAAFISRLKLLAGMDIADKRQPQDGRYAVTYGHREIDARVSSVPTINGEKLVIRLLDQHAQLPDLARLGMPPLMATHYRRLVNAPWGFVVVAGPTGSGKTTTLYASLAELDAASKNILSVEDPVEMRVRESDYRIQQLVSDHRESESRLDPARARR